MEDFTVRIVHTHSDGTWQESKSDHYVLCPDGAMRLFKIQPKWRAAIVTVSSKPREGARFIRIKRHQGSFSYSVDPHVKNPRGILLSGTLFFLARKIPELRHPEGEAVIYVSAVKV